MSFAIHMDKDGIPNSNYGIYRGMDLGWQRSVLAVASRGLWYWNQFDLGGQREHVFMGNDWKKWPVNRDCEPKDADEAVRMFTNCADWLLENCLELRGDGSFLVWAHPYPFTYGTSPGWASSHSQAVGIQLLIRANELTGNDKYIDPVERLLGAFDVPVPEGGILDTPSESVCWYEKFASVGNSRPMVLNGHLFALLGLHDVSVRTGNKYAQRLFDQGFSAAEVMLPRFDAGDWTCYDVHGKRASKKYHKIHIKQLHYLSEIRKSEIVSGWLEKIRQY